MKTHRMLKPLLSHSLLSIGALALIACTPAIPLDTPEQEVPSEIEPLVLDPAAPLTPAPEMSAAQRFDVALEEQKEPFDLNAANRTMTTNELVESFLPEAAEIISQQKGITHEAATLWIQAEMLKAANQAEDEYVAEYGYGTIVRDLRSSEYRYFILKILESKE